jgi:uncharacterized membrane protein YjjP (DUF1212 family)
MTGGWIERRQLPSVVLFFVVIANGVDFNVTGDGQTSLSSFFDGIVLMLLAAMSCRQAKQNDFVSEQNAPYSYVVVIHPSASVLSDNDLG